MSSFADPSDIEDFWREVPDPNIRSKLEELDPGFIVKRKDAGRVGREFLDLSNVLLLTVCCNRAQVLRNLRISLNQPHLLDWMHPSHLQVPPSIPHSLQPNPQCQIGHLSLLLRL
jgi:hypothetical protein